MTRKLLPVLDRRLVLRGIAASVAGAALAGCMLSLDSGSPAPGVDGAPGSNGAGGSGSGSGSMAGATTCTGGYCLDLADPANAVLRDVGGARVLDDGDRRIIVVHVTDTEFVALSAVCTHAGCIVRYSSGNADLECPCHGSMFALDGSVTHGPAVAPLAAFPTTFDASAGIVTIALS